MRGHHIHFLSVQYPLNKHFPVEIIQLLWQTFCSPLTAITLILCLVSSVILGNYSAAAVLSFLLTGSPSHLPSNIRRPVRVWNGEGAAGRGGLQSQNAEPCQKESAQTTGRDAATGNNKCIIGSVLINLCVTDRITNVRNATLFQWIWANPSFIICEEMNKNVASPARGSARLCHSEDKIERQSISKRSVFCFWYGIGLFTFLFRLNKLFYKDIKSSEI